MFIGAKHIYGTNVEATDGTVGAIRDVLFDDQTWKVRFLVVETGTWFASRHVLLSPDAIRRADWAWHRLSLRMTRQEAQDSPSEDTHLPVARRREMEVARMIAWEGFWTGLLPSMGEIEGDPHLRNTHAVAGHHMEGSDGPIGHVEDFIIDDQSWMVRYLVVDTRNWWPGKRVLIAPTWVESISWDEQKVCVAMSRDEIQHSPEYDPAKLAEAHAEEIVDEHHASPLA